MFIWGVCLTLHTAIWRKLTAFPNFPVSTWLPPSLNQGSLHGKRPHILLFVLNFLQVSREISRLCQDTLSAI